MDVAQRVVSSDGRDLDLLENQAALCCLLFSVLLEVEILVLRKVLGELDAELSENFPLDCFQQIPYFIQNPLFFP